MRVEAPAERAAAVDLYGSELMRAAARQGGAGGLRAVDRSGAILPLALERYLAPSAAEEMTVLERVCGPVLDVGCGPGRHLLALARSGIEAVGIEIAPLAVRLARSRGARVIDGSIFDHVPGAGRWGTALLLDGNIGIGGAPTALLERIGELLHPDGLVLVELEAPGARTHRLAVSLQTDRARSEWFPWARISVDAVEAIAADSGFVTVERWQAGNRWFAALVPAEQQAARVRTRSSLALVEADVAVEPRAGEALRTSALGVEIGERA